MNYSHHYDNLIDRAKNRIIEIYEIHHIIPRCIGGTDCAENLVKLSPEEHYLAHQLLVRIYPDNQKLIHAAMMMTRGRPSNKIYGWLRRRFISLCKQRTGSANNSFGTIWINNGVIARKVSKNSPIPTGWKKGRSVIKGYCQVCKKETFRPAAKFCNEHRIYMKPERLAKIKKPFAKIQKNGTVKEVPRNQVPSYRNCGWTVVE